MHRLKYKVASVTEDRNETPEQSPDVDQSAGAEGSEIERLEEELRQVQQEARDRGEPLPPLPPPPPPSTQAVGETKGTQPEAETVTIRAFPLHERTPERKDFFKSSPGGELVWSGVKKEHAEMFGAGKEFYIEIWPQ